MPGAYALFTTLILGPGQPLPPPPFQSESSLSRWSQAGRLSQCFEWILARLFRYWPASQICIPITFLSSRVVCMDMLLRASESLAFRLCLPMHKLDSIRRSNANKVCSWLVGWLYSCLGPVGLHEDTGIVCSLRLCLIGLECLSTYGIWMTGHSLTHSLCKWSVAPRWLCIAESVCINHELLVGVDCLDCLDCALAQTVWRHLGRIRPAGQP